MIVGPGATPWVALTIVWLTLAISYGLFFSFSIFFVPLLEEFRLSRGFTAGIFSLSTIVQGLASPVVGALVDRVGPRRVLLTGATLLGAASILASRIQHLWELYLITGVMAALGLAGAGWVPSGALLARWFARHRGGVIGLAFSGMGIGILVVGPVAQFLIVQVGWRQANLLLGSATLSLLVPLLWFGVKNAPPASSEVGPRRGAGGSSNGGSPVRSREEPDAAAPLGPTVREALATRPFWALFFAFLFTPLAVMPVFTHQVAFAVDQGFSRMFVASIFGLTGLLSSVGRVGFGMISDRIGRELSATLSFGCTAGGTLVLLFLEILPHPGLLYAYAILFGLGFGARGPIVTAMATDFFGGKRFGAIYGILNFGNGIGAAVGPWFSGVVHDATGSYRWAFLTSVAFCVVASACFWAATSRGADAR